MKRKNLFSTMQKITRQLWLACLVWVGTFGVGKGQVINTVADLETALASVVSGSTLHLNPNVVYEVVNALDINTTCTIDGHGATIKFSPSATVAQNLLFDVGSGATATLKNLHLQGKGNSPTSTSGAISFFGANVTVEGCEIHDFYPVDASSGAISNGATNDFLKVKDCYFYDNGLRGISNASAGFTDFEITNTTFANHTEYAVSFQFGGVAGSGTYLINNCTFFNNATGLRFSMSNRQVSINQCTFFGGTSSIELNGTNIVGNIFNTAFSGYTANGIVQIGSPTPTANTTNCFNNPVGLETTLSNRGGFAPVLAFSGTSTLLNAAISNAINTDQRGAGVSGLRDAGAYELDGKFLLNSAPFTVSNSNPFGLGSLYAAINNANNQPAGADDPIIRFNLSTSDINYIATTNHWRIQPISGNVGGWSSFIKATDHLPTLTRSNTTIDGEAGGNGNTIFNNNTALLRIELDGNNIGGVSNGLNISATGCTITDLNINDFQGIGIRINNTGSGSFIRGCFIGTDIRGNTAQANVSDGIYVDGASNITIGGTIARMQNIISGNSGVGIAIAGGTGHTILGNVIGLNALKNASIPNGLYGIAIVNSTGTTSNRTKIGDAVSNDLSSNLISGNVSNGIYIQSSSYIDIYKNYIGIQGNGSVLANTSEGIRIWGNSSKINIGNGFASGRNVIGGQLSNITLFETANPPILAPTDITIVGNNIGIGADGTTSLGGGRGVELIGSATKNIYISKNIIACNVVKGIASDGLANEGVISPVITTARTHEIRGTAAAIAGTKVEVYRDNTTCSTSHKQGREYLGEAIVDVDVNNIGNWVLTNPALPLTIGDNITAIQHAGTGFKNTSEFSVAFTVTPNALPTSTDITVNDILEDLPFELNEEFVFEDTDISDTFLGVKIISLPVGSLRYDDNINVPTPVSANTLYDLTAGKKLIFNSVSHGNGSPYATFTFKVVDSQGGESTATYTATLNVLPINDAPTIDAVPTQSSISLNKPPTTITLTGIGTGGGTDENTQTLTIIATVSPNFTALMDNPTINYTSPANTPTLTYSAKQAVTNTVTIPITIKVKDNGGKTNGGIDSTEIVFQAVIVPNLDDPYDLIATLASSNSIALAWQNDVTDVTSYEIHRAEDSPTNFSFLTYVTSTPPALPPRSYTDSGLISGKYYYYKVRSVSSIGSSEFSNISGVLVGEIVNTPTNLQVSTQVDVSDKLFLTWQDNSNDEDGFLIERYDIFSRAFLQVADLPANTVSYTDVDLLPNIRYTYRVRAYKENASPSPYSNEVTQTTPTDRTQPVPSPPFDLQATSVSPKQINLSWIYNTNPSIIYLIERSITTKTNFTEIAEFVSADLTTVKNYIDTIDVVEGEWHYYRVRASTGGGLSAYSLIDSARAICNLQDLAIVRTDNGKEVICSGKSASMSVVSKVFGATYQWKRNGVNIEGATFETFYASQTGVYTCTISVAGATSCSAISVNSLFIAVLNSPDGLQIVEDNGELIASLNDADAYQWYYDYKPINGATTRNHKPTKAGVYYVTAAVENCVSTSPTYFYGITATEKDDISAYISLFPNPTEQQTEIRVALPTQGKYEIRILDTKGKLINRWVGKKMETELTQKLMVNSLPTGVYVIEFILGNQRGYKKLVVK
jgi:hypothetical protein